MAPTRQLALETDFSWKALGVGNAVPRLEGTGRPPLNFCAWSISMLTEVCRSERPDIFYLHVRLPPDESGAFSNVSVASCKPLHLVWFWVPLVAIHAVCITCFGFFSLLTNAHIMVAFSLRMPAESKIVPLYTSATLHWPLMGSGRSDVEPPPHPLIFVAIIPAGEIFRAVKATFDDLEARYTFPRRLVSMGCVTTVGLVICRVSWLQNFVPTQYLLRRVRARCYPTLRSASIQSGSTIRGSLHITTVITHRHIFPNVVLVGTERPYTNPCYFCLLQTNPQEMVRDIRDIREAIRRVEGGVQEGLMCLKSLQAPLYPYPHLMVVKEIKTEGKRSLLSKLSGAFMKDMTLHFLCPVDMSKVPCGDGGEGYRFRETRRWVKKISPALQVRRIIAAATGQYQRRVSFVFSV